MEELVAQRKQKLQWQLPETAPVHGDPVLLRLLLRNLVENAHRYSPEGSSIRVQLAAQKHGYLLQVIDEGPNQRKWLANSPRRFVVWTSATAAGLGLNIVTRIVQLHQGRLTMENRQDTHGLNAQCWLPENVLNK